MGKPGALRRLLRSCLTFPVHKHNKREVEVNNSNDDGEGDSVLVHLPEDIILDVLARLPVKTLCQLRCVSKAWRALISDPAFIAAHGLRVAAAPLVMGVFRRPPCPRDKRPSYLPFRKKKWSCPLQPDQESLELRVIDSADGSVLRVVGDVRGSMLMRTNTNLVLIDHWRHGATVVDPSSGRGAIIAGEPDPKKYPMNDYNRTREIVAYTPSCSSTLGRASPSGAYKIVRLCDARLADSVIQICQICTLGLGYGGVGMVTTRWRQRPEPPFLTRRSSEDDSTTATADGILHFLDTGAPADGKHPKPSGWNRIASFDLESEEWKASINGPPIGYPNEDERWDITIAVLRGSLRLVQTVVGPCSRYTSIWSLVDTEKSTWVKQCTIQMPECWCYFDVLDILVDGRILMLNSFEIQGKYKCILRLYYPKSATHTDIMEMSEDIRIRGPLRLYTQSLLS